MISVHTTPTIQQIATGEFAPEVARQARQPGWRFGHITARSLDESVIALEALLLDTNLGHCHIVSAPLEPGTAVYPALTPHLPAAHWAERAIGDMFGIRATGHPRWKSLILHEAWPAEFFPLAGPLQTTTPREPYHFLEVKGEGIHEIPVGPIHAGIIEPGHFRFSCVGEVINNLEIRLGYLHRGVEQRLTKVPWPRTRFIAESASSDTAAGNALAHVVALEQLLHLEPPPRAQALRTIALEIERLANHAGDLGALAGDISYSAGSSLFPPLRGAALALAQLLSGNRRQRWYIVPGGVQRDLDDGHRKEICRGLVALKAALQRTIPLVLENQAVLERMEGTGRLAPALARDFGIVGPAGRASGSGYDARSRFAHGTYPGAAPAPARRESGDVLARAQLRVEEIGTSIAVIEEVLDTLPAGPFRCTVPDRLPADAVGVGVVEAWRGELIHWITTAAAGAIARYAIKDPSFNNWTGLAIAARGNLVADFPLCNKSFNLSYSGNDL